ncbi:MAG: hypothetical protein KKA84_16015 [Bacteroidetes bacterium]|nr:hypothetical protein [Bacteroidota bacterium]
MIKTSSTKNIFTNWNKITLLKVVKRAGLILVSIILLCAVIMILFPDPLINTFFKKPITKAFTKAYPAYSIELGDIHYNIWNNRLGCNSITLKAKDSTLTCNATSFSFGGIGWIDMIWNGGLTQNSLTSLVFDAKNIVLNDHKSQNKFSLGMLHASVPDSEITADSIMSSFLISDEQFFAKSQFRQTRYRFSIPQVKIKGLDFVSLFKGNIYKAKSIIIHDVYADILVNMDKPYDKNSSKPLMPNEILSSMKEVIEIDSVKILNGRLKYCEQYAVKATPGEITFDNVNVSISGIANHSDRFALTVINAEGIILNSGAIKLLMEIPLASKDFSLQSTGSLSTMDVIRVNTFLEAAEHRRVKSGIIQYAKYNINVASGQASGTLQVEYEDLSIIILSKNGSENEIVDQIASLIGKTFIINGSNLPDKSGKMKIGEIKYSRNRENTFFQFLWFSLRSGISNVVGF